MNSSLEPTVRDVPAPAPEPAPGVSAVLLCRNEIRHIEACLTSLLSQVPPPGGFELLVVDGMSDDGTRAILEKWRGSHANLRIIDNPGKITPCGMNVGIRAARGHWIAILGSHSRYAQDYLLRCYEVAQQTGADNVGGPMQAEGSNYTQKAVAAAHHSPFACGGSRPHNLAHEGPLDTVWGGFYRREVFDRIGLFDETLVRNQDDELNLRLTRAGGRIWQSPRIRSWYSPRSSLRRLFEQYQQYGYWKVRVIQKHRLPASWRHLVPGAFVLALLILAGGSLLLSMGSRLSASAGLERAFQLSILTLGGVLATYAAAVLLASVHTAAKTTWSLLPALPLVFLAYHVGYGWGFLRGVFDFILRRQHPQPTFAQLTR